MMRFATHAIASVLLFMVLSGSASNRITIKGSDTMVILVQLWTERYPGHNQVEFQITGGGSGTGFAALINNSTTLCASSRPIKKSEVAQLKENTGYRGLEVRVARDGLSIYIHNSNPVRKLTLDQLRLIFTGKITNWKDVGGNDAKIIVYSRENNSGTYEFFKENVLQKQDFADAVQHMPGTAALINAVEKDKNAIGYGGAAYTKSVRTVAVAPSSDQPYVLPNTQTISNGSYPISRFLYFYMNHKPTGIVKSFIDWVLSAEGQRVVTDAGYYTVMKQ
ncbi:MAG: Phosphate-binding protein PstS [Chlorobi bacterium]|nr:MAG: phosphate ABC transporter substrate-binding protein [Chlorobi bacterium OLB6]MBV6462694.1 Phosphate-binding protein PstS [Chlorobiota bacterium]